MDVCDARFYFEEKMPEVIQKAVMRYNRSD